MRDLFGWVSMHDGAFERANQVQQMLTEAGTHRSTGPIDLLIAATAERERLAVLCDDHDYQTGARVAAPPVELVTIALITPSCHDRVRGHLQTTWLERVLRR